MYVVHASMPALLYCKFVIIVALAFLPARRYVSAGLCDSDVSVRPSVRLSGRPSHAGIPSLQLGTDKTAGCPVGW